MRAFCGTSATGAALPLRKEHRSFHVVSVAAAKLYWNIGLYDYILSVDAVGSGAAGAEPATAGKSALILEETKKLC